MAVHVDYDAVQSGISQLDSAKTEMENQLRQLQAMVNNLVQSGFHTDVASGKFQESYTQWNTGANNVLGGLDGMSGFLKNVISQHQQLDSSLGQSASSA
ncbi:MAG: WXG100 family type VII secretion target [Actinomycetota bacterium]|nr:WXG100 family type VII secretion target [Actinomycetota bacterium]